MVIKTREELIDEQSKLVDLVQTWKIKHAIVRNRYAHGAPEIGADDILDARGKLEEAEAALQAHIEVYGRL